MASAYTYDYAVQNIHVNSKEQLTLIIMRYTTLLPSLNVTSHTADSKPVKQEVNGTAILPPLVFPANSIRNVFNVA